MPAEGKEKSNNVKNWFLGLDSFGEGFNFKLPDGKDNHQSMLGSVFSIILALIMILYGTLLMQRLVVFGETVVTMSIRTDFYTPDYVITPTPDDPEDEAFHLKFAFAITAYDGNRSVTEDPDYGLVKAKYVSWGGDT